MSEKSCIIYDSQCKLCTSAVRFLRNQKDPPGIEYYSANAPESEQLFQKFRISRDLADKTIILIDNNQVYTKSTAVIRAMQKKRGIWKLAFLLEVLPVFIRDAIYDYVARNRK
jgi:predicted DCC family thiol-disulfide oxidoreductase YuxK